MSTNRGIFESFPNQPVNRQNSPFAVVNDVVEPMVATSPFAAAPRQESPFTVVDDAVESRVVEPGRPARVPERRKQESPFQVAEPTEGYGFEAPAKAYSAAPFEAGPAPVSAPAPDFPFTPAPQQASASPFSIEPQRGPSPSTQAAIAAFNNWQEAPAAAVPQAFAQPAAAVFAPAPAPAPAQAPVTQVPSAFAPAPQAAPAAPVAAEEYQSDSFSIRQLELRAIFGVDREMNPEEILQRARSLPGMRNISRVSPQDMVTVEALKHLLPNLGFGTGGLKLYSGSIPLEFIREGSVMLAMQTDGGFAPGVRETLMIVARELGRLS
jgi:hypothetical protein